MNKRLIQLFTIGSGGKSAQQFFTLLSEAGIRRVIDVRLFNTSHLAGYTKCRDLAYFLDAILQAEYQHQPILAPTKDILNGYKKGLIDWTTYEYQYKALLEQRQPHRKFNIETLDYACLLCAESKAECCHRRLAGEYLQIHFPELMLVHI